MKRLLRIPIFTVPLIWTLVIITFCLGWWTPEGWAMLAPAVSPTAEPQVKTDARPAPSFEETAEVAAPVAQTVVVTQRSADLQQVQRALEMKIVQQRLTDYGLTAEQIQSRVNQLSDAELHQMASQIDTLIPGGDAEGIVIALLVIAILVVILIYLLGHRVVVTKDGG